VVGVTGSNGKTSTKDMVYGVLSTVYKVQKTEGNFNNHYGLPLTILQTEEDTDVLVLEMGMSSRGEIELLSTIAEPDVAIITNIGESHLYIGDEPLLQERIDRYKNVKLISFGQESSNEYFPVLVKQEVNGTSFTTNKGSHNFFIPVLGKHNVFNALAAIAVGQLLGVSWEDSRKGLSQLKITQMRSEVVSGIKGSTLINDAYNASPTSMKAAIQLLQDLEGYKRKILVLGDMLELGDREQEFHKETGETIDPGKVNMVYTFGERGKWIAEGAKENLPEDRVLSFLSKDDLVLELEKTISDNDVVLFKASRGIKLEEVIDKLKG
jgi:UDP-N-acetylmuramoyl-tripeptide--D-alanyl-D-alanine ligase